MLVFGGVTKSGFFEPAKLTKETKAGFGFNSAQGFSRDTPVDAGQYPKKGESFWHRFAGFTNGWKSSCSKPMPYHTWIRLFDAWKKFQTYSPKWWCKMVMNPMVQSKTSPQTNPSIRNHLENKSIKTLVFPKNISTP